MGILEVFKTVVFVILVVDGFGIRMDDDGGSGEAKEDGSGWVVERQLTARGKESEVVPGA